MWCELSLCLSRFRSKVSYKYSLRRHFPGNFVVWSHNWPTPSVMWGFTVQLKISRFHYSLNSWKVFTCNLQLHFSSLHSWLHFKIQPFEKLLMVLPTVLLVYFPICLYSWPFCVFLPVTDSLLTTLRCICRTNAVDLPILEVSCPHGLVVNDFFCYFAFHFWLCLCHLKLSSISQKNNKQTKKITTTKRITLG